MAQLPELAVSTASELDECCRHVAGCRVFGFDTEFIGESTYHPQLCLVQVATPERLYIIDPLAVESLAPFWELVACPQRVTVVHAGREEIRMCQHNFGKPPGSAFDLQIAAGLLGAGYPAGHASLVQQFLRVHLSKGETLTDWSRRPLTRHQVQYAYDDVRYLLPLYDRIHGRLTELGRLDWVAEETEALMRRSVADDPELEPWRKLRGLGGLDRKRLAIVREVFSWREARAARVDRPARFLLRDDLIIEVAKRQPKSERDLNVMRGLPRGDLSELIAAVDRAKESDPSTWPTPAERENDPPQVGLVTNLLQAVLGAFCGERGLTSGLAATTADLKALVRSHMTGQPLPEECSLARGWRSKEILPVLVEVIQGRRGIRVGDLNAASPFSVDHV